MYSSGQIKTWLELFKTSDNKEDFEESLARYGESYDKIFDRVFLKRDLLEAKVQVDRWGVVTTDWIFHVSKKPVIEYLFREDWIPKKPEPGSLQEALLVLTRYASILESDYDLKGKRIQDLTDEEAKEIFGDGPVSTNDQKYIWGAAIHFTEDIDPNTGIGLSLESDHMTLCPNNSSKMANSIIVFPIWDDPPKK